MGCLWKEEQRTAPSVGGVERLGLVGGMEGRERPGFFEHQKRLIRQHICVEIFTEE